MLLRYGSAARSTPGFFMSAKDIFHNILFFAFKPWLIDGYHQIATLQERRHTDKYEWHCSK